MKTNEIALFLLILAALESRAQSNETRNKRTVDFVIRGVADIFGYDVQKRPAVITTAPPAPPRPTFFPPPVKPLPGMNRFIPMGRTAPMIPPMSAPAAPMPAPAAPMPPPAAPMPPPAVPMAPSMAPPATAPPMAPPAPPQNPRRRQPTAPAPPARPAAPPRQAAPPLLTENIRKTFNIAFNYDRGIQTVAPPTSPPPPPSPPAPPAPPPPPPRRIPRPPAAAPPPSAAPAPLPPAAPAAPPAPPAAPPTPPAAPPTPPAAPPAPPSASPAPPSATPAASTPPKSPPVASSKPPPKAKLYSEYDDDYEDGEDPSEPIYGDYSVEPENNYEDSKQRFRQSLHAFWEGSPWIQGNGYKYLTSPEEEPRNSRYEEYVVEKANKQKKKKDLVFPKYVGVLPSPLHKVGENAEEAVSGLLVQVPYDAEFASSQNKPVEIDPRIQQKTRPEAQQELSNYQEFSQSEPRPFSSQSKGVSSESRSGYDYVPDSYDANYSYTIPEPVPYQYPKIGEDIKDVDLVDKPSANLKVRTNQSGKRITNTKSIGIQVDLNKTEASYEHNLSDIFNKLKTELVDLHKHVEHNIK